MSKNLKLKVLPNNFDTLTLVELKTLLEKYNRTKKNDIKTIEDAIEVLEFIENVELHNELKQA